MSAPAIRLPYGILAAPETVLETLTRRYVLTPDELEKVLRAHPAHKTPDEYPLTHHFAPGVYMREIAMPAGDLVIGRVHRTEHLNVIVRGDVSFWVPGETVRRVTIAGAPVTFTSRPGARKILYLHEETVWMTIHPTTETDVAVLERDLVEPAMPLRALPEPASEVAA